MKWFDESIPLFTAVQFDGESLPSKEFFEAALNCRNIYKYVWGGGMICRQLEKDLNGSAGPCLLAYNHNPEGFPAVEQAPKELVQGVAGFKKGLDVRDKLLWCNRALRFIISILSKLVSDEVLEVHIAAKATYNEVLAPHHSWPVRQVARTALSQCPWRRDMLSKLEMTNDEFVASAKHLLGIMVPQVAHAHAALVSFGLEKASDAVGTAIVGFTAAAAAGGGTAPTVDNAGDEAAAEVQPVAAGGADTPAAASAGGAGAAGGTSEEQVPAE